MRRLCDSILYEIYLISDDDDLCLLIGIVMNLVEPTLYIVLRLGVGQIVHQNNPDGILIISTGDSPKGLLSCLHRVELTVSQICILTTFPAALTFLVANSTPMVGLLSLRNTPLTNIARRVLLPTDASPTMMNLKT